MIVNETSTHAVRYSCAYLNQFCIAFHSDNCISLCCSGISERPRVTCAESSEKTINEVLQLHKNIIAESTLPLSSDKRIFTKECVNCLEYQPDDKPIEDSIGFIVIAGGPAPCNAKCFYCSNINKGANEMSQNVAGGGIMDVLEPLEYARTQGFISPSVKWHIARGEITILAEKDDLFKLIANDKCVFASNCFIFDQQIGNKLSTSPESAVDLSIDAGTAEAWHKVKGFDNFAQVMDNLKKYRECSRGEDPIRLKYIVIPEVNDTSEDFASIVNIMKSLGVEMIRISRNVHKKNCDEDRAKLIPAIRRLISILRENGLNYRLQTLSRDEIDSINK